MKLYTGAAVEAAMKRQEIILRAYAGKLTWIEAAEVLGMSCRHLRRLRTAFEEHGFFGLFDGRLGKTSPRRTPVALLEEVLRLYQEQYHDFNVRHFHEKLVSEHGIEVSYTWTKGVLQGAGLVAKQGRRKKFRKRRERRPLPGMMLHVDASTHQWFADGRYFDLIVILDDATSEICYAQLVGQESTATVMTALRAVVEEKGVFCTLYSDRASHFFQTPKAGEPVDRQALTQIGRALRELRIQMIAAYSPQARGRSERSFRTWQGRLPQELRIRDITTVEQANLFLRGEYTREFNGKFSTPAREEGTAFVRSRLSREEMNRIFSIQHERLVNRDNTVRFANLVLQIERVAWHGSLADSRVKLYQHLDDTISIGYGTHTVGRYSKTGHPIGARKTEIRKKKLASPSEFQKQPTGHLMC